MLVDHGFRVDPWKKPPPSPQYKSMPQRLRVQNPPSSKLSQAKKESYPYSSNAVSKKQELLKILKSELKKSSQLFTEQR